MKTESKAPARGPSGYRISNTRGVPRNQPRIKTEEDKERICAIRIILTRTGKSTRLAV